MTTATASSSASSRRAPAPRFLDTWIRLLREPRELVDDVANPATGGIAAHAPALLAATALGGALLGGVVGSHHGGLQTVYAAAKTPLLLVVPPLFALPAVEAAWALVGTPVSVRRLRAATLVGMARTAVLAAALGPFVWLWSSAGVDYHAAVMAFAGTLVLAGIPGLLTVLRALPRPAQMHRFAMVGSLALLGAVFAQTGWLLRPFVARPTAEVTFLRSLEEDVFSSLLASQRSARGNYSGWETKSSGFLARDADSPVSKTVEAQPTLQDRHVDVIVAPAAEPSPPRTWSPDPFTPVDAAGEAIESEAPELPPAPVDMLAAPSLEAAARAEGVQ